MIKATIVAEDLTLTARIAPEARGMKVEITSTETDLAHKANWTEDAGMAVIELMFLGERDPKRTEELYALAGPAVADVPMPLRPIP